MKRDFFIQGKIKDEKFFAYMRKNGSALCYKLFKTKKKWITPAFIFLIIGISGLFASCSLTIGNAEYGEIEDVIKEKFGEDSKEYNEFVNLDREYTDVFTEYFSYWKNPKNSWKYKKGKDAESVINALQRLKDFFDKYNAKKASKDVVELIELYQNTDWTTDGVEYYCKYVDSLKHKFVLTLYKNGSAFIRMEHIPKNDIEETAYSSIIEGFEGTWRKNIYTIGDDFRHYYDVGFPSGELYVTGRYVYTSYTAMTINDEGGRFTIE